MGYFGGSNIRYVYIYICIIIYENLLSLSAQACAILDQKVPDPHAPDLVKYQKILKASHVAAVEEMGGLQTQPSGSEMPPFESDTV